MLKNKINVRKMFYVWLGRIDEFMFLSTEEILQGNSRKAYFYTRKGKFVPIENPSIGQ